MDDWTPGTVKAHVVALLEAADKRYEQRFQAAQEALRKADETSQRLRAAVTAIAIVVLAAALAIVGRLLVR